MFKIHAVTISFLFASFSALGSQNAPTAVTSPEKLYQLPPFQLQEALSDIAVTQNIWKGKTSIVSFYFASCEHVCGFIMGTMGNLQKKYQEDPRIQLVSITTDPKKDTAASLKIYAAKFKAEKSKWLFLTGDLQQTVDLVSRGFKLAMSAKNPEMHSEKFALVDSDGWIRGYFTSSSKEDLLKLDQSIQALKAQRVL
jgi:protein SCO1/2